MKKTLLIILCLAMILSCAACGKTEQADETVLAKTKEYEAEGYKFNLPETYEFNDLVEVNAEEDCIAMLTDSESKLPDLWVYVDDCQGTTLKDHILAMDETWDYKEMSYYGKDGINLAKTVYDEEWFDQNLVNEHYYRIESGSKVLSFDFAYPTTADAQAAHEYITAVAEVLGF